MIVVLFRSKLVSPADGYDEMAQEMEDLARTMPGFIDVKAYKAADGERLTVVWWENEETLKGWRENVRHRVAQRLLVKEILDRIPGEAELREDHEGGVLLGRPPRELERALRVEGRVREPDSGDRGGDAHESVAVERSEGLRAVPTFRRDCHKPSLRRPDPATIVRDSSVGHASGDLPGPYRLVGRITDRTM